MSRRRLRNGAAQRRRAKRKAMAKNGAENGAAPKAKIAKKVDGEQSALRTMCHGSLNGSRAIGSGSCSSGGFAHFNCDGMADACEPRKVWMFAYRKKRSPV